METGELVICNVQANLGRYQDAPNFTACEMNTQTIDETDRNVLSTILGSKFEHGLKYFHSQQTFLMRVISANTNSSVRQPVNNINICRDEVGSSTQDAKSKFETLTSKFFYVRSTFYPLATLPKSLQPSTEVMFMEMLRIVHVPADYEIHFKRPTVHFEFLAYTCTVSKAKNGYASSTITDLPALQLSSPSEDTSVCTLKSSALTRFYESSSFHSRSLIVLPTSYHQNLCDFLNSFASKLKKTLLVYGTSKPSEREMIAFQMLSCLTSYYIHRINCLMLLFEQENSQAPMLSLGSATVATSCTAVCSALSLQSCRLSMYTNSMSTSIPMRIKKLPMQATGEVSTDKKKIEASSSLLFQCGYVIPDKTHSTTSESVVIVSPALVVQSLSDSNQLNKSTNGTSVAISRASPSMNQVKVHSSVSLIPAVIPNQDYFEQFSNILLIISHLSCIPVYPEQFEGLQLLPRSMQLQISAVSDLGMPELHQKDLREKATKGTLSHHSSPLRRSNNKRSILKRLVKVRKPPKCCLHTGHYSYGKFLWSQLRGKKINSISLRKGLMPYASTVHNSRPSLRLKQASVIPRALEESRAFNRGVALFRGGKSSTLKSDTSATSSENDSDSDTDSDHTGPDDETPLQNSTSTHETSHSNGAMNLRPFSDVPPPFKMSGGETDRYMQSSQSPAVLITKSSEQLVHSQGASNYVSEPLQSKQAPHKSPSGSGGSPSFYGQPKLEVCIHTGTFSSIKPIV
jgi:hypothetical protein